MKKKTWNRLTAITAAITLLLPGMTVFAAETAYTTKQGDNLSKIAKAVYGDSLKWRPIYECNKNQIKDPNLIYANQTLVIPDVETETVPAPGEAQQTLKTGWFEAQGLTITPQGNFTYQSGLINGNSTEDIGTVNVPSNITIAETTAGMENGYKMVMAAVVDDLSRAETNNSATWVSAFDRYTGTSFEFDLMLLAGSGSVSDQSFVTIVNGSDSYDISMQVTSTRTGNIYTTVIAVICPADYNGTVFQVGHGSLAKIAALQEIFTEGRLYTINELPYFGDGYYYFSYSDK